MSLKRYKHYLKKNDSIWYAVVNGNVIETGEKELQHAADGWENGTAIFTRDTKLWGIFEEHTIPYEFILDGAQILRSIYYDIEQGSAGKCIYVVKILNPTSMKYEPFFNLDIDFSQARDFRNKFVVNAANRGLQEQLNINEDITYELDLNAPESINMSIDGVLFDCSGNWYPGDYSVNVGSSPTQHAQFWQDNTLNAATSIPIYDGGNINQPLPFIKPKTQAVIFGNGDMTGFIDYTFNGNATNYIPDDGGVYILKTNVALKNVNIDASITEIIAPPSDGFTTTVNVYLCVMSDANPSVALQQILVYQYNGIPTPATFLIAFNITIDMPANTYLILTQRSRRTGPSTTIDDYPIYFPNDTSFFNIKYQAKSNPTDCKGLRCGDAMRQIVNKISNGQSTMHSLFLDSDTSDTTNRFLNWDTSPKFQILTSATALQQIVNPVIKTTFSDMFDDMFARMPIYAAIVDGNLNIGKLSEAFSNTLIARVDSVNNIEVSDYKEKMINSVDVGYDYSDTDTTNGKQSVNTGFKFLSDRFNRTKQNLTIVSKYVAEPTAIERVRGQVFETNNSSSTIGDSDVYLIEVDPTPVSGKYVPYRPSAVNSGVTDPLGIYNITQTPGRAIRRFLSYIRSVLPTGNLIFQSTDQNKELISTFGSGQVIEKDNLPLNGDMYKGHDISRYFLPYVFEFDCPSIQLYNQIKANPLGYIEFPYYDKGLMKGYVLSVELNPEKGDCKCLLLSHPNNDLSKLKR